MDGGGQQDFNVYIGNIPPQAPDNLTSVGNYNTINLDWDADATSGENYLNDIGNRYPAEKWNVYRDDEPRDQNSNDGSGGASPDGPEGCNNGYQYSGTNT